MTGVRFDPNNFKSLTLGNIFQMDLHRFTGDVNDIVNESVQELKIEHEIRKIETTWKKTEFVLAKYHKNGVDRSYVLRAADDVKSELEDNLLNLQTMSASRYVGSFAEQVWIRNRKLVSISTMHKYILASSSLFMRNPPGVQSSNPLGLGMRSWFAGT